MVFVFNPEETLIQPWEKQRRETPKAFSAFKAYRDMHPSARSLSRAVILFYGEERKSESKLRQFKEWSRQNAWVVRASAWDEFKDKEEAKQQIEAIKEMGSRHVRVAKTLQQKAIERLLTLKADELTVADLLGFITTSIKIERTAAGVNNRTEETHVEMQEAEIDLTDIPTARLRQIIASKLVIEPPQENDNE